MDCYAGNTRDTHHYLDYASSMLSKKRSDVHTQSNHNLNHHFICPHCDNPAQNIELSRFKEFPQFLTFSCNCKKISSMWCVCVRCSINNQPKPIAKYRFKYRSSILKLISSLESHTCEEEQRDISPFAVFENDSEDDVEIEKANELSNKNHHHSLFHEISKSFPPGNKLNDSVMNSVLECNGDTSLPMYYIAKYWMKCVDCKISTRDTIIFLRLMKSFVFGSRNENTNLAITIGMIEERSLKRINQLHQKIASLENQLVDVRNILESHRSTLEEFGIEEIYSQLNAAITKDEKSLRNFESTNEYVKVELPTTVTEVRTLTEGTSSFFQNLIIPQIYTLNCGYAYVLPSDCLRLSIAMGSKIDLVKYSDLDSRNFPTRSIFHSREIQEKVRFLHGSNPTDSSSYYSPIGLWSDGCDIGGASKSNRSLVKLHTIHIPHSTPNKHHVFPIALGSHKSDHNEVRRMVLDDLEKLESDDIICYVPSMKKSVKIRFFLAYIIQDRVEHSEFTGFMSHAGTFSTMPGFSFPIRVDNKQSTIIDIDDSTGPSNQGKPLSSCHSCSCKRKSFFELGQYNNAHKSNDECEDCYDWNIASVKFKPLKDYPKQHNDLFSDEMCSKPITFESMKIACRIIYSRIWTKTWTVPNAKSYAQLECLTTHISTSLIEHAKQNRPDHTINIDNFDESTIPFPEHLLPNIMVREPLKLEQCTVGAMHTLVLNLGKHILSTMVDLLREKRQWTGFYNDVSIQLKNLRSMSLSWCKPWDFGSKEKPGSLWVSENYLGFAIVSKSIITTILQDGFHINENTRSLLECFFSYNTLISCLMDPSLPGTDDIMRMKSVTKLFLSDFQSMDSKVTKRSKSKIETASCLVNILAIPDTIEKRGILRNYWEGGICGEGFFRIVKPLFKRGIYRKSVVKNVMSKLFQDRCITEMLQKCDSKCYDSFDIDFDTSECESSEDSFDQRYRRFHSYKDVDVLKNKLHNNEGIAIVYHTTQKEFYGMVGYGSKKKLIKMEITGLDQYLDTSCFKIETTEEMIDFLLEDLRVEVMLSSIALPMPIVRLEEDGLVRSQGYYYIRTELHTEYIGNDVFQLPSIISQQSLRITIDRIILQQQNSSEVLQSQNQEPSKFCDRDFCKLIVGQEFIHDEGMMIGVITKFFYKQNKVSEDNCRWVVKYYYPNDEERSRCKERKELNVQQIGDVVNLLNIDWSAN